MLEKIGNVTYKLKLPESTMIHLVFHVALLKPFHGMVSQPYVPLPLNSSDMGQVLNPLKVLDVRVVRRLEKEISQVLIQWEATEVKDAREDLQDIVNSYPQFNLKDKVVFDEKGNVTCVKSEEVLA